ncbi:hypothetical protein MN202_09545 [Rheinheimera muenzenbergensis]|uniref:Uncharacterized protein n=1 Tax=Rheinheimera muenzenbergensis TaxID=1193628 RepID=A0ABU8C6K0_9GAMM
MAKCVSGINREPEGKVGNCVLIEKRLMVFCGGGTLGCIDTQPANKNKPAAKKIRIGHSYVPENTYTANFNCGGIARRN